MLPVLAYIGHFVPFCLVWSGQFGTHKPKCQVGIGLDGWDDLRPLDYWQWYNYFCLRPFVKQTYIFCGTEHHRTEELIRQTLQNAFFFFKNVFRKKDNQLLAFCNSWSFCRWALSTWADLKNGGIDCTAQTTFVSIFRVFIFIAGTPGQILYISK